jgi:hypothetical protein
MTLPNRFASVLRWLFRRDKAECDLNEELEAFVDMAAADRMRAGAAPAEARRLAMLDLGGVEQTKEHIRSGRHGAWLDELGQDLSYAVRTLRRNPGFAIVVVLTLALGLGANTAIFSIVNAVLLKPTPYDDAKRLVRLIENIPAADMPDGIARQLPLDVSELLVLRRRSQMLSHIAFYGGATLTMRGREEPVSLEGARVESAVFSMLGAQPIAGRVFESREEVVGNDTVVVLGHRAWMQYWGGDPGILGRTVTFDDRDVDSRLSGSCRRRFSSPMPKRSSGCRTS